MQMYHNNHCPHENWGGGNKFLIKMKRNDCVEIEYSNFMFYIKQRLQVFLHTGQRHITFCWAKLNICLNENVQSAWPPYCIMFSVVQPSWVMFRGVWYPLNLSRSTQTHWTFKLNNVEHFLDWECSNSLPALLNPVQCFSALLGQVQRCLIAIKRNKTQSNAMNI